MKKKYILFPIFSFLLLFIWKSSLFKTKFSNQYFSNRLENEDAQEARSGAMDALQFFSAMNAYPQKDIPDDSYTKGFESYKNSFQQNKMQSFSGNWSSIGPNNVGGRTLCMAFDPVDTSIIWLGSASGGLWKSITGGMGLNAWTYIPTGYPVLGVSSIAIDPNNNNVMYIGTGETYATGTSTNGLIDRTTRGTVGIGILKSVDGGITWTQSLNWSYQQQKGIWEIIFNPLNTSVLYAGTTDGIYKSTDAGASWSISLNVQMAMDLYIDKTDTNIIYAGVGNLGTSNKGLYKTTNSGTSWNILTNGLPANAHTGRIIISAYSANDNILMCEVCNAFSTVGIYRSIDQGASWTAITPAIEICSFQGWYSKGLLIKADDSSKVLIGGVQLFRSNASGNNFFQVSNVGPITDYMHADVHDILSNPLAPEKVYVITDGGLTRSNDFGTSFNACIDGYVTSQFYIGSVSYSDSTLALGGAQDNYTQQFYGNLYWNAVFGGDGSYNTIDPTDDYFQLCSFQYLNIVRSTDQGNNFFQVVNTNANANASNSVAFLAPIILAPSNPDIVYAAGDSVIKSIDGGATWSAMGSQLFHQNAILSIGVSFTNEDSLYVATVPGNGFPMHVFRSGNGAGSFTDITTSNLPDRYPRRITVNPKNSSEVYIIFSGFGTGHIFKSINAGNTWTDVSGSLPDIPFHCMAIDPLVPNHLFAGSDFGIFASPDGGNTWTPFNDGFPEAVMIFDLVSSAADRSLRAYTHGHGVFKRSFNDFNTGQAELGSAPVEIMKVFPNPVINEFTLSFENVFAGNSEILITSVSGEVIMHRQHFCKAGLNQIPIKPRRLPAGVYFVSLKKSSYFKTIRIAKI